MNSPTEYSPEYVNTKPTVIGNQEVIRLENISVRYRVPHERINTIKEYMIRWVQKKVTYDDFLALQNVNLTVYKGEVFGLIGQNGAGKSTLLKLVARVLKPTQGRVWVKGRVAPLLELGAGFHPDLTGRENIYLYGALLGFTRKRIDQQYDGIVEFSGLGEFIDAPIRTYSSGMTARLGFAIATDVQPNILIVDEILGVGDEAFQRKCAARIQSFRDNGASILVVSHNMESVQEMCQRVACLEHGKIQFIGTPTEAIEYYRSSQ